MVKLDIIPNRSGEPISVLLQFVELELTQSIFDTKMVGTLVLSDNLNFSETVPLVGLETMIAQFKTKGAKQNIEIIGRVFAVEAKGRMSNEKTEVTKLRFISDVQYKDHFIRVSTAKKGSTGKVALDLFRDNFGKTPTLRIDETDLKQSKFIFPYWSPLRCINWLSQRSFTPGGSNVEIPSCYVFYEDIDGFHFRDIMLAVGQKSAYEYRVEPNNAENQSDINRYLQRVQEYSISSHFDRLKELNTGMYAGSVHVHDITKKKYEVFDFDYRQMFDNAKHLNKYPVIPYSNTGMFNATRSFRNFIPTQSNRMDGVPEKMDNPEDYFSFRASILRQFNTIKVSIQVPGNSSLRLLDVIDFDIPKIGFLDSAEQDWKDIQLSGRYLIVSSKHIINSSAGYTTTFELAKDSLIKGIPDRVEPNARGIK